MSISGARPAFDIDLEEYEKRLRAAGAPAAGVEDPLAELARLVEASRPRGAAAAVDVRDYRPALEEPPEDALSFDGLEEEADDHALRRFDGGSAVSGPEPRRSRRWTFTVSALALAGIAMIGGVFVLKGKAPGFQKEPPFIAAAVGPTKVQPPSDATVSASDDAGGSLLKDETRSSHVKVVNTEEQPVDLNAQTASQPARVNTPASQDQPPPDTAQPSPNPALESPGNPAGSLVRGTVDTPVVIGSAQSPAPSPFPEPKAVRTISLRPDGTPIPAGSVDAQAGQAPPSEPAQAPRSATAPDKAAQADAANAQSSTPKIELPTKLSPPKSSARVVVAKTDTTAPADGAEAAGEPEATATPAAKPEKPKAKAQAPAPVTAEAAPSAAAQEPTDAAATSSGGWAVQLAAPRSETEARAVVAKLNEKYASALGGTSLGVHKASVNGETVYRVRVVGLSKTDAAALCARLKGNGGECFVAK
jgi:cell division protein FtsN